MIEALLIIVATLLLLIYVDIIRDIIGVVLCCLAVGLFTLALLVASTRGKVLMLRSLSGITNKKDEKESSEEHV